MLQAYLTRPEAAEYIRARGLILSKNTLQKYATVGGGPMYRRFGRRVVYTPADLDAWIERKLSAPVGSTAEFPPSQHTSN